MPTFEKTYTFTNTQERDISYNIKIEFEEKSISAWNQILYKETLTDLMHAHLQSYIAEHDTDFFFMNDSKQHIASMLLNVINYHISFKKTWYPKIRNLTVTNISEELNLTEIQRRIDAFDS